MPDEPITPEAPEKPVANQSAGKPEAPDFLAPQQADLTVPERPKSAFQNLARELSPEDLMQPGVHKLLLERIDTSESECQRLRSYEQRYHDADKKAAVFESKLNAVDAFKDYLDIINGAMYSIGGALLGLITATNDKLLRGVFGFLGVAIIISAILARVVARKRLKP